MAASKIHRKYWAVMVYYDSEGVHTYTYTHTHTHTHTQGVKCEMQGLLMLHDDTADLSVVTIM